MTVKSGNIEGAVDFKLRKLELLETIANCKEEEVIAQIEEFFRLKRIADYEKEMSTPLSVDDYADGIKQAIDEIERGEGIDEADLIREIEAEEGENFLS